MPVALTGSGWTGQQHRYTQLTPRVGATYLFEPHSAAFLSYGRSFRPNSGTTAAGDAFEPEKGTAWELGYKWDAPDGRLNASVSAFRIQKDNVLSTDPDNPDFSIATGRVRSQGVEADLAGDITPQVRLTASAAFIDAKVTRDTSANRQGKRFNGVPRVSGSLFALYQTSWPMVRTMAWAPVWCTWATGRERPPTATGCRPTPRSTSAATGSSANRCG